MTTLPKPIQAQVEQAEAILADMNKSMADENQLTADAAPVNQPVEELQVEQQQPQAATPSTSTSTSSSPSPPSSSDNWEHKYKTLQGRYNSEVPRLQAEIAELKAQLAQALAKIDELSARPEPKEESQPVVDSKDVEAFGEDLVDMVRRVAERVLSSAVKKFEAQAIMFEQRLAAVEQQLKGTAQTVVTTAEQAFFDRLTRLVPNWEEINSNPAFLEWLGEIDPIYGQSRQAALDAAHSMLDADRVAAIFKTWEAIQLQSSKASSVDKQISPKSSAASSVPTPAEKPILTQKQIQDFYNDVARGRYRGREQEMQRIEAMINAAIAEGRIR